MSPRVFFSQGLVNCSNSAKTTVESTGYDTAVTATFSLSVCILLNQKIY